MSNQLSTEEAILRLIDGDGVDRDAIAKLNWSFVLEYEQPSLFDENIYQWGANILNENNERIVHVHFDSETSDYKLTFSSEKAEQLFRSTARELCSTADEPSISLVNWIDVITAHKAERK